MRPYIKYHFEAKHSHLAFVQNYWYMNDGCSLLDLLLEFYILHPPDGFSMSVHYSCTAQYPLSNHQENMSVQFCFFSS